MGEKKRHVPCPSSVLLFSPFSSSQFMYSIYVERWRTSKKKERKGGKVCVCGCGELCVLAGACLLLLLQDVYTCKHHPALQQAESKQQPLESHTRTHTHTHTCTQNFLPSLIPTLSLLTQPKEDENKNKKTSKSESKKGMGREIKVRKEKRPMPAADPKNTQPKRKKQRENLKGKDTKWFLALHLPLFICLRVCMSKTTSKPGRPM